MKSFSSRRRQRGIAFTLVELLVVIAIIAILAAVIIGGVSSALRFAKRTKANAMASQLSTAVQNYYTEYSVYPTADAAGGTPADDYYDATTDASRLQQLTWALCGNINPLNPGTPQTPAVPNTRAIAYLTPTRGDLDGTYGIPANPFGSSATSPYYFLAVDTDYSGVVGDSGGVAARMPNFSGGTNVNSNPALTGVPGGVAVWCSCDQPLLGAGKPSNPNFWAHTY
jgi:prepilin-type N-terminal cleavage/methylation domain-containing protein